MIVWQLLPDAKIGKNIPQELVIGHLPGNRPKMVQSLLDVDRHQVAGQVGVQSVFHILDFLQGFQQGSIVAGVGHDGLVVPQSASIHKRKQLVFEFLHANILFGRNQ